MAEQSSNPTVPQQAAAQPADPLTRCREITTKNPDFYDIDVRFRTENIEKTALNYVQKKFYGRAGKQFVFLAAHVAKDTPDAQKPPEKFIEYLKKAIENYEKYFPSVIPKYQPALRQIIDNLKFLVANPDLAFKAEIEILRKTGKIKTTGLQLAK